MAMELQSRQGQSDEDAYDGDALAWVVQVGVVGENDALDHCSCLVVGEGDDDYDVDDVGLSYYAYENEHSSMNDDCDCFGGRERLVRGDSILNC